MPYSNLILTAGISACAPRNVLGARFRENDSPLVFPKHQQNPSAADPTLGDDKLLAACREFAAAILRSPEDCDPKTISAEFSALQAIASHGKGLTPEAQVHLIHTPTLGGRLAIQLSAPIIEARLNVRVHPVELSVPFDPSQAGGLALASGAFIGQISRLLRGCNPHDTAFVPIGGYKSMVALGHIAASFHGFSSLYLHEDSQVLQEIAPAPISLSAEVRDAVAATARRVGNGAEWAAISPTDQRTIESHPAFFTRVKGFVELNELGQFRRLDQIPIRLSPEAADALGQQPELLNKQLHQIRDQAAGNPDHPGINHDLVGTTGRNHPWRVARMGSGVRIAWQFRDGEILICKIWRNHDAYNNEAPKLVPIAIPAATLATWTVFP